VPGALPWRRMSRNRSAAIAWVISALLLLAAVIAVVVRPTHWERTAILGVVLAVIAGWLAMRYSRGPARTP